MPQTYRVKLSDGREFDVRTDGGPPSEDDVLAQLDAPPAAASSQIDTPAVNTEHPHARVAKGAANAVAGIWNALPIPEALGGSGVIDGPKKAAVAVLRSHLDQYLKAKQAQAEGRTTEMVGHSVAAALPGIGPMAARAGEMIGNGEAPEAVGELMVAGVAPTALSGAARGLNAARSGVTTAAVAGAKEIARNPTAALIGAAEGYQVGGVPGAIAGGVGLPVGIRGAARMLKEMAKSKKTASNAAKTGESSELTGMASEARELSRRLVLSPQDAARLAFLMERLETSAKEAGMTYAGAQPKRKG